MFFGLGKEFDRQTAYVSIGAGACFASALWLIVHAFLSSAADVINGALKAEKGLMALHAVPLIFAFLFLLPLFMMNSNVIKRQEGDFDFDNERSCRRKLFFTLVILQFVPFMASVGFLGRQHTSNYDIEIVIGMFFTLFGALLLKIGTYKPKEEENSF